MNVAKKFATFVVAKKKQIATVAIGQSIYSAIGWVYDNPLYIAMIALYGPVVGGGLMTLGSLVICFTMILWYNKKGVDWLGVGAVDSIRELSLHYAEKLVAWRSDSYMGKVLFCVFYVPIRVMHTVARLVNHSTYGDSVAFVLLSIFEDPFVTTAYLRHGNYGKMRSKDWAIFGASVVLSNGYWILRTTVVIEVAMLMWRAL